MGSGVSLPAKLSESELKRICACHFEPSMYAALKDVDDLVDREIFLSITSEGPEKELFYVFMEFCPTGEMDSRAFLRFCKDSKSLNKAAFSSGDADLIFQKFKTKYKAKKYLNFSVLRKDIIPAIANKKSIDIEQCVRFYAKCTGPAYNGTTEVEEVRLYDETCATSTPSNHSGNDSIGATPEQHNAAVKLQTLQRSREARKKVEAMREIQQRSETINCDKDFEQPLDSPDERHLQDLFVMFSPTGEMDLKTFLKFCKESNLFTKKFTPGDADLFFYQAKVMSSSPLSGPYQNQLVHGKRMTYILFRAVPIPSIASKKNLSVEQLLEQLRMINGPQLILATASR